MNPLFRLGFIMLVGLISGPALFAQEPPAKPYSVKVVLSLAEHRIFTPLFQDQLQRDVRDQLRLALGSIAQIEVVRQHPLLGKIQTAGLESALETWVEVSPHCTFFVLVRYEQGLYEVETRYFEGWTGQASPLVRHAQTGDRASLAGTITQLVEDDYAPSGTVQRSGKDHFLVLRGGADRTLDQWIKAGRVFSVSRVEKVGDQRSAQKIPWALLEIAGSVEKGKVRCHWHHRFLADEITPDARFEFRASRPPTSAGPVRLKLVDFKTVRPLSGITVSFEQTRVKKTSEVSTNRDGLAISTVSFPHFALVQLKQGAQVFAQFPAEVLADHVLTCRVAPLPDDQGLVSLILRHHLWNRRLLEDLRVSYERFEELNGLLKNSMESALEHGKAGLKHQGEEIEHLTSEAAELTSLAQKRKLPAAKFDLHEGEKRLDELRQNQQRLEEWVNKVDKTLKDLTSPERRVLVQLLEQAALLETQGEFDQALDLYRKVLLARPDESAVRDRSAKLKKTWEPKSPAHAEARQFLLRIWPGLTEASDLKENLTRAEQALKVCKEAGDTMTLIKVRQADVVHASSLKKKLDALARRDSQDNRNQARLIQEVAEGLGRFHVAVVAQLARKE